MSDSSFPNSIMGSYKSGKFNPNPITGTKGNQHFPVSARGSLLKQLDCSGGLNYMQILAPGKQRNHRISI